MKKCTIVGLLALLTSCMGGPSAADIAADRARWTAVRDVTADGSIDAATGEAAALADLLVAWDAKLTADETAAGSHDPKAVFADMLRVYGSAVVDAVLMDPALQAKAKAAAPDVFAFADKDANGSLSLAELLAVDPRSPVFATVVASTLVAVLRRHR